MARQQGYIAMIPVFIPVPKNDLKHQVDVGRALAEVIDTKDLNSIISLPGARFHPPKSGKDIITRWTSVEAPAEAVEASEEAAAENDEHYAALDDAEASEDRTVFDDLAEQPAPVEQDEATTTGRRRRSAA